ncbi:hypothetical protein D3C87_1483580 [compost metagenome]
MIDVGVALGYYPLGFAFEVRLGAGGNEDIVDVGADLARVEGLAPHDAIDGQGHREIRRDHGG